MKQLSFFLFLILTFVSCQNESEKTVSTQANTIKNIEKRLDIYAFHGTRQCSTCKNMKAYTKATLNKYFAEEIKSGILTYHIIDVDDEQNYELAEKYEASGTALMVNLIEKGNEKIEDWSEFAFEYAPGNQKIYEKKLRQMINDKLN